MLKIGDIYTDKVEVPVVAEADVVIVGGGTAGCVAAIAAARNGASVLLVERYGFLGGMMTAGNAGLTMYTKFSGKPAEHEKDLKTLTKNPEEIQIVGGIVKEVTERILKTGVGIGNSGTFGSYVFTSSEDFKWLLFRLMKESNVKLRLHSLVVGVIQNENKINGIVVESKSGRQIITAKQFIDASGDGDVAVHAGVPYTVGVTEKDICAKQANIGEMHPMGVMFKVGNVKMERTFSWLEENPENFREQPFAGFTLMEAKERFEKSEMAVINIVLKNETVAEFQVYNLPTEGVVTLCCPSVKNMDGCNVEDLTKAEIVMADMLKRWMESIHKVPGFEKAFLLQVPEMGVRETRHIQGDYLLELMDIYKQKKFEDCIGLGSHPIDTRPRPEWLNDPETAYPSRWYFQIPFRSLIAKTLENLLIAGRCISATHEAFGCIRPTVQCMITGEAAGTAASMCSKQNVKPRDLNTDKLRKTLKAQGVVL